MAFLVDLWKLRGLVERMTRAAEEDLSEDSAGVLSEATHIHFFVPCQINFVDGCKMLYPLVIFPLKMVIFHSYVSLPEGKML